MGLLLLLGGAGEPNVRNLFAQNEPGLAIDVEQAYRRGWVFQDANGLTVSASPGDPVGLILDTSRGGLDAIGSDLVSNGTFATDTVWTKGANWTIGSGVATKTGGAANNLTQTISSTAGLWYRITMDVTRTAGTLTVSLGTSGTTYAITATGTYTFFILAGSSTQTLTLAGDSAFAGTVDNVTARLVPGNHAYQTTSGSRPALCRTPDGGRRNLLTYSEQFDVTSSGWTKAPLTITANSGTGPLNSEVSADTLNMTATPASGLVYQDAAVTSGTTATFSLYVKKGTGDWIEFFFGSTNYVNTVAGWFNISTGAIGSVSNSGTGAGASIAITDAGNGWYRCSLTGACSGVTTYRCGFFISDNDNSTTRLANGTCSIWGAQLETGSTATTYQRVTTTHDVTESGKRDCWGLLADGSDDSLITTSVDFSSTDKMTVMAGVRKNSDSADAIVCELTTSYPVNAGSFYLCAPEAADSLSYSTASRGTASSNASLRAGFAAATGAAPDLAVLSATHDLSGDLTTLRRNGVAASNATGNKGSGNFTSSVIYIFRRGGSTLYFPGILYTLIIRGAATPTGTIADFEKNLLRIRAGLGPF
jgi:hypothetical protein